MVIVKEKGIVEKYLIKISMLYYTWFFAYTIMLLWVFSSFELNPKIVFTSGILFTWVMVAYAKISYKDSLNKTDIKQ